MADRIKPLMGVHWEEGLDKPLDGWRKELNIEPIRQGQNGWYEVLADLEKVFC
jgi:ubiquinone biosynthesis protein COQ4